MLALKNRMLLIILILKSKPQRAGQAIVINVQCLGHFEFGMSKIGPVQPAPLRVRKPGPELEITR